MHINRIPLPCAVDRILNRLARLHIPLSTRSQTRTHDRHHNRDRNHQQQAGHATSIVTSAPAAGAAAMSIVRRTVWHPITRICPIITIISETLPTTITTSHKNLAYHNSASLRTKHIPDQIAQINEAFVRSRFRQLVLLNHLP